MTGQGRNDRHTGDGQGGASFLELIVALSLLGFLATAIAPLMLSGITTSGRSQSLTELAVVAAARMEWLIAQEFDAADLVAGGSLTRSDDGYSASVPGDDEFWVRWQIVDESPMLKRIIVVAGTTRSPGGRPQEIRLATFKIDRR